ncbi:MAG: hypothetical protein HYV08_10415 [Deltaproteobacteria bacterium]|nr:hypothetical protein [Deltaproteobacteria bacterium]
MPGDALLLAGLLLAGGLLAGLSFGWFTGLSPGEVARWSDGRLGLRDRLSTALEFLDRQDRSPLIRALVADAAARAEAITPREVFPHRWPRVIPRLGGSALVGALILALPPLHPASIPLLSSLATRSEENPPAEEVRAATGPEQKQEEQSRAPLKLDAFDPERRPRAPTGTERLQERSAAFKDSRITQRRPDFSSFLRGGDERLKMMERLDSIPDLRSQAQRSPYQILLNRNRGLNAMGDLSAMSRDQLRKLMEELGRIGRGSGGDRSKAESYLSKILNKLRERTERGDQRSLDEVEAEGEHGGGSLDRSRRQTRDGEEGEDEMGESGSLPGKGTSRTLRGAPSSRITNPKLDMQLSGQKRRGQKDAYDTNAVGPGAKSRSRLPYMDLYTQYRKMMEEALTKENIPFDYREQIKEYFESLER